MNHAIHQAFWILVGFVAIGNLLWYVVKFGWMMIREHFCRNDG